MDHPSSPTHPSRLGLFNDFLPGWQMVTAERCTLLHLLRVIRPPVAIEIGTAGGGSLSAIAPLAGQVYTLDVDAACAENLGGRFSNVRFLTGSSADTLPPLIAELTAAQTALGFVLIDGSHDREAVRADIENLLAFRPTACPLYVLMHDSFNPACRAGIAEADWASNPHVHQVQLDYVTGVYQEKEGRAREMWGGFALALLRPEPRLGGLQIAERQGLLFRTLRAASVHLGEEPSS